MRTLRQEKDQLRFRSLTKETASVRDVITSADRRVVGVEKKRQ